MQAKGNVSILVMFIMIATSLMGLLAMHFVNQMMEYSWVVHDYYKTYYLSKAGVEIGLTEANVRGLGFSTTIGSWFFADNFLCSEKGRCSVDAKVKGKSSIVREKFWNEQEACTEKNAFHLIPWDNLIVPLFYEVSLHAQRKNIETPDAMKRGNDSNQYDSEYAQLTNMTTNPPQLQIRNNPIPSSINLGVVALKKIWDNKKKVGEYNADIIYFKKLTSTEINTPDSIKKFLVWLKNEYSDVFTNNFLYLLIGNANKDTLQFCITVPENSFSENKENKQQLPTQKFRITSKAKFDDTTLSLEAKYKQAIPSFFMNIWGY